MRICREVLCRLCVCTNSSPAASIVSGGCCGPVRGNTTTACVMVKQPLLISVVLPVKQRANHRWRTHDTVSAGHIIPAVRAGSEMWSETNDLMFKSVLDKACRITLESGIFCHKCDSVIFLRSFGYIFLIGKSLTLKCPLHRSSAVTYYTVMSKGSSPLPLKLFACHVLYLNRSSSASKRTSF